MGDFSGFLSSAGFGGTTCSSVQLFKETKRLFSIRQVIYLCCKQTVKAPGLCFVGEGNGRSRALGREEVIC